MMVGWPPLAVFAFRWRKCLVRFEPRKTTLVGPMSWDRCFALRSGPIRKTRIPPNPPKDVAQFDYNDQHCGDHGPLKSGIRNGGYGRSARASLDTVGATLRFEE